MRKNSIHKRFFKYFIKELLENGELKRYKTIEASKMNQCTQSRTKGEPLGILKVATLFVMLTCGIIMSFIISVFEYFENYSVPKSKFQIATFRKLLTLESTIVSSMPYLEGPLKTQSEIMLMMLQEKHSQTASKSVNKKFDPFMIKKFRN